MSEALAVCKALATMIRSHGEPTEEEVRFIAHATFDMRLSEQESQEVAAILRDGQGNFPVYCGQVQSKPMRLFLFRRVVTAALLDQHLTDAEKQFIETTASTFGYQAEQVSAFIDWVKEGIQWEARGTELMQKL